MKTIYLLLAQLAVRKAEILARSGFTPTPSPSARLVTVPQRAHLNRTGKK
jgi:hypothetical protein